MNGKVPKFILLERLIVIAIIAIRAAILLPALNAARMRARAIFCINNLKQSGLALSNYDDDYADYLPSPCQAKPPIRERAAASNRNWGIASVREKHLSTSAGSNS